MNRKALAFALTVAVVAVIRSPLAVGADEPDTGHGTVEMIVRAPDGQPVADAKIEIVARSEFFQRGAADHKTVATDKQGLARFKWTFGTPMLYVKAEGVGYTSTGTFNLPSGDTVRVPIPRLMPFSIVEGTLAKELRVPDAVVELNTSEWLGAKASPDKDGHFVIKDAPCGGYWVQFKSAANNKLFGESPVWVEPGKQVSVAIAASEAPKPIPYMPPSAPRGKGKKSLVWAEGTVRDEVHNAIEGAQVIAEAIYFGGMRSGSMVHSSLTDADGHWQIVGETDLSMFHGTIVAYKFGYPYVAALLRDPYSFDADSDPAAKQAKTENPTYDFVLSAKSANLEVLVTRDNKPAADFAVRLSQEDVPSLEALNEWTVGGGGEGTAYARLARIIHPVSVTGDDGIARFDNLNPGSYKIEVDKAAEDSQRGFFFGRRAVRYDHVVVGAGPLQRFHATRFSQDFQILVHLRKPDGTPAGSIQATMEWARLAERYGSQSYAQFDRDGKYAQRLQEPGLWSLSYTYGAKPGPSNRPQLFEPYYNASAIVAASPSLPAESGLTLTAIKHQHKPGSLVIHLQDGSGKPAFGYVCLDRFMLEPDFAGSTDENGEIRFMAVTARETDIPVDAYEPAVALPAVGQPGDPFPSDKELIGRTAIFSEKIKCPVDTESHLTIRPKPVGYVRGIVRPAPGMTTADYLIGHDDSDYLPHVESRYDEKTGRFLVGPFAEGSLDLNLQCLGADKVWRVCASKQIQVHGERVADVQFVAPALAPAQPGKDPAAKELLSPPQYISIGAGGASVLGQLAKRIEGTVFLPDGRTPAREAQVVMFDPPSAQPVAGGTTDFDGRFSLVGTVHSINASDQLAGPPQKPRVVAWRPGQNGFATAPASPTDASDHLRIKLPPPLVLHGRVTVGGASFSGRLGIVHIMAVYEGHGLIAGLCRQEVSADADGNFELAGLTPGTYQLQATLDNIWLSPSQRAKITVDSKTPPAPIRLDISEPGKASTINLVDKAGRGVPNVEVTVDRPEGPLAPLLWPHALYSDGAGCVHIPPLEAGEQKIRIAGAVERTFRVPRLTDQNTPAANPRVVVDASAK